MPSSPSLAQLHSRRFIPQPALFSPPAAAPAPNPPESGVSTGIILLLAAVLCAVICAMLFNSLVKCAATVLRVMWSMSELELDPGPAAFLPEYGYKIKRSMSLPTCLHVAGDTGSECAICLTEFVPGEYVHVLPACNHGFHVDCIDQWLRSRPSCPICRRNLLRSCRKLLDCEDGSLSALSPAAVMPMKAARVVVDESDHQEACITCNSV